MRRRTRWGKSCTTSEAPGSMSAGTTTRQTDEEKVGHRSSHGSVTHHDIEPARLTRVDRRERDRRGNKPEGTGTRAAKAAQERAPVRTDPRTAAMLAGQRAVVLRQRSASKGRQPDPGLPVKGFVDPPMFSKRLVSRVIEHGFALGGEAMPPSRSELRVMVVESHTVRAVREALRH
jgi:hypothetical protein